MKNFKHWNILMPIIGINNFDKLVEKKRMMEVPNLIFVIFIIVQTLSILGVAFSVGFFSSLF